MSTSDLEDPGYAAFAWHRYRRILGWMAWFALACAGAAILILWLTVQSFSVHVAIAAAIGVGGSVLMAGALMGLIFLSSGSGHDERIHDPLAGEVDPD